MGCLLALVIYDPRVTIRLAMPGPVRDTINAAGVVGRPRAGRGVDDRGPHRTSTCSWAGCCWSRWCRPPWCWPRSCPTVPSPGCSSTPPLQWLGRVAIALYLVHWPVFVWIDRAHTSLTGNSLIAARLVVSAVGAVILQFAYEWARRHEQVRSAPGRGRAEARLAAAGVVVTVGALLATTLTGPAVGSTVLEATGKAPASTSTTTAGAAARAHRRLLRRRPGLHPGGERQVLGGAHRQDQGGGRGGVAHLRDRSRRVHPGRHGCGRSPPGRVQHLGHPMGHGHRHQQARHRRGGHRHQRAGRPSPTD